MPSQTILRIPTRVMDIREEFRVSTSFKDAEGHFETHRHSLGWFVLFEGSRERLFAGAAAPEGLAIGDTVFIDVVKPGAN